jgi:diaminopimelate epimerase
MKAIEFIKMVASGNDFVVIMNSPQSRVHSPRVLAKKICDRKFGIGADGLLILEKSKVADVKMRIFNADGSEAQMCGNGARCVALWMISKLRTKKSKVNIETKAGIIESQVTDNEVRIKLTDPKDIKLDFPIGVNSRTVHVNFINTGVAHTVIFVQGLDKIDVFNLGRLIRYHRIFKPRGTNVDFVEVLNNHSIKVRTYERGVEDETLACGTGIVASSIIFALKTATGNKIRAQARSGEILTVYFKKENSNFSNVWLEGNVRIVHKGAYYV